MNNSPTKNFQVLLDRISLSRSERAEALKRAKSICEVLNGCPLVRKCIITGSMARSTAIRTFSDVDIVATLKSEPKMAKNSALAIEAIAEFLSTVYSDVEVFDSAVRINLPNGPGFDVVPALPAGRKPSGHALFEIPAGRQAWTDYAPDEQNQRIAQLAKRLGDGFKQAIRLAKWWSRTNGNPIPSYEIEDIAIRTFQEWNKMPPRPEALASLLKEAARSASEKVTDHRKDLVQEAALSAQLAIDMAEQGDTTGSVERWRCLLGEQFPAVLF